MGLINVQHPKTKLWRQFSTYIDRWCCDWMSEEQYKEYLINQYKCDLDNGGLKDNRLYTSIAEMDYKDKCQDICKSCTKKDCDNCSTPPWGFEGYKSLLPNNPLHIDTTIDRQ